MKIEVNQLKPNPFRHLERYPIDRAKVEALKRSIKDTGFWDNILVRKTEDGHELAYGHHRLLALKESNIAVIDVPVRDLDETTMAQIMAHENMEEWGHSAIIEQETVRAIVEGYAQGQIQLPEISKQASGSGPVRYAPSFQPTDKADSRESAYSATTLAEFLGWNRSKVAHILDALSAIEDKLVDEEEFKDLTTRQAESVASQARRVARQTGNRALARKVGKRLAQGMKQSVKGRGRNRKVQDVTIHNARRHADAIVYENDAHHQPQPKILPEINQAAQDLAHEIGGFISSIASNARTKKLKQIVKEQTHVDEFTLRNLKGALEGLAERATEYAGQLYPERAIKSAHNNQKLLTNESAR